MSRYIVPPILGHIFDAIYPWISLFSCFSSATYFEGLGAIAGLPRLIAVIPVALGPPPGEQRSCRADFGAVAAPLLGRDLGLALEARGDEARCLCRMRGAALLWQDVAPITVSTWRRLGGLTQLATGEARVLVPGQPEIWGAGRGPLRRFSGRGRHCSWLLLVRLIDGTYRPL
ncbi:hypothetical protein NDU88_002846 [Pleurodeles waltl]|uniref:Uncharacterized protein n=1 Tax=Pleurodeles waltl TaxID=8319 RepID=A0AAV7UBP7_PLEWA|nr:hypothetical protein NDU88_002846 [Pleurodeles waltl]